MIDHLLITAGWDGDDRVRCICSWHCAPGEGALDRWLDHVANPDVPACDEVAV